jgi:hypothetical protein
VRDIVIVFVHLIVALARLARPGGLPSVVAESVLVKHQLRILSRAESAHPTCDPKIVSSPVCAPCSLRRARLLRSAIVLKPPTLLLQLHRV